MSSEVYMLRQMIHGARLSLRPITTSDIPQLFSWRNSPDYVNFVSAERRLISEEEYRNQLCSAMKAKNQVYFMIEKNTSSQTPMGLVHVFAINSQHKHAFINLYVDAPFRKYGYGAEAGVWLVCHLFDDLKLHKVYCDVLRENQPSLSLVTNVGFEVEGTLKEHCLSNGVWSDVVRLALFEDDKTGKLRKTQSRLVRRVKKGRD